MIYLDNAATTKPREEVLQTVIKSLKEDWYNPSSQYLPAQDVHSKMNNARTTIANKTHCKSIELYFTSSGSEANSMALSCLAANGDIILIDPCSHSSVLSTECKHDLLHVDKDGFIDIEHLERKLKYLAEKGSLFPTVSINGANNEIGTIQNIKEITDIVHKYNGLIHIDGVQLFANQEIDINEVRIDLLSISAHKIGCFSSIAALYIRRGLFIPSIINGSQERGKRGGTENVPYILGFAKAVELLDYSKSNSIKEKRNYFIEELLKIPNTYLVGTLENRLSNNINICFKGIDSSALISYLDLQSIYCSSGSACNSLSLKPSHVLKEIKLNEKDIHCCVRFSINSETTIDELKHVALVIEHYLKRLRTLSTINLNGGVLNK